MGTWRDSTPQDLIHKLGFEDEIAELTGKMTPAAQLVQETAPEAVSEIFTSREDTSKLARENMNFLAGLAMPTVFEYMFPPVLVAVWQLLQQYVHKPRDFSKLALGIPRGHAKTTLMKLFILYCILFTNKRFILIISSTASLAENVMADVFDMLSEGNIKQVFGNWEDGIQDKNTNNLKKFGFRGRNIIVAALGCGGSLRGMNLKNERPDIMLFDDIQTKECSESEVQTNAIRRWMYGTAMKAKSPRGCLYIFCGNMYPGPNSLLKQLRANKSWIKFISGAILADGTALWEELHPLKVLLEELDHDIDAGHPEIFFAEIMNDTEVGTNNKVDLSKIEQWPYGPDELPQGKFLIIDPSTGKGLDNTGIGYFEIYDGLPGLRELVEADLSPGNTIRQAILLCLKRGVKVIAIESTGYQSTLLYWFGVICEQLGITGLECVEIYRNQMSKNAAIASTIKALTANEIRIHGTVRSKVTHQIANWNPLKRDNNDTILDLLDYAPRVIKQCGYQLTTPEWNIVMDTDSTGVVEDNHAF